MKIIDTTDFKLDNHTAVAIGKFDGIHKGHQKLLQEILSARRLGLATAIFTFDPSPSAFFSGETKELMTRDEKRDAFEKMGIDYLVEYPFNGETAKVEPEAYVKDFLLDKMQAKFIVAGQDVSFGNKGAGDAALLQEVAKEAGAQTRIIPKLCYNGREISSTYVREAVQKGEMELACELMGSPFFVKGTVMRGNQIGRKLGMPTVNVHPVESKILPPNGVYFSTVTYGHQTFYGVTNVGYKPTVEQVRRMGVETYIYDFNEDIYDKEITVSLLHFERPEQKFADLTQLQAAVMKNIEDGKAYFQI